MKRQDGNGINRQEAVEEGGVTEAFLNNDLRDPPNWANL